MRRLDVKSKSTDYLSGESNNSIVGLWIAGSRKINHVPTRSGLAHIDEKEPEHRGAEPPPRDQRQYYADRNCHRSDLLDEKRSRLFYSRKDRTGKHRDELERVGNHKDA